MHNFLNPYKHKRKLGRAFKRASDFVLQKESTNHKDFDWHERKNNPYSNEKVDWYWRLKIGVLFFLVLSTFIFIIYHPYFKIKNVEVTGIQRISLEEFKNATLGIIDYNRFLFLPGKNYFFVNMDQLNEILKQRFPLSTIITRKVFPDTLSIQIEEKISTVIYDNGKKYNYLGVEGKIVEVLRQVGDDEWQEKKEMTTSTDVNGKIVNEFKIIERKHLLPVNKIISEMGDYPIVYDKRGIDGEINTIVLSPEIVKGVISWFNFINKRTNIPFAYIEIDNDLGEGNLKTLEGWYIKIKLNANLDEQLAELQYLLQSGKINRQSLNYIDLRFLGKVFWQ